MRAKAQLFGFSDDQVIVQRDVENICGAMDLFSHADVGLTWAGVTRRMVVHKDDGSGVQFQGAFDDLARVDRNMVNGAARLFFVGDQGVFGVEKEDAELFGFPV